MKSLSQVPKNDVYNSNLPQFASQHNHASKKSLGVATIFKPMDVAVLPNEAKKGQSMVDTLTSGAHAQSAEPPQHKMAIYPTGSSNVFKNILNKKYLNNLEQPGNYATT